MTRSTCRGMLLAPLLSTAMLVAAQSRPAATGMPATSEPAADRAAVEWVDAKTGKVLFSSRDIVRFDWDRQVFELTRERAMDLMSLPPTLRRDFVVRDREGDIYRGCFMSALSSFSYDGPTISSDFFEVEGIRPPLYHIGGGYPGEHDQGGKRRFDPRLKQHLDVGGLLRSIREGEKVEPVETVFCGWHGEALGRRAAIRFFPETIRLGRDIRLVLRFHETKAAIGSPAERERDARRGITRDPAISQEPDRVEARITLRSNDGKSERTTKIAVPVENLIEGFSSAFKLAVWPWSESGRSVDERFKPGPAELIVSIVAVRKTDKGIEQVGVWDIPTRQVQILPSSHREGKWTPNWYDRRYRATGARADSGARGI